MEESTVSFETAKLDKEKGFNQGRFNYPKYDEEGNVHFIGFNKGYSAPTQSLLQKWLREKHNIECYAYPFQDLTADINDPIVYKGHRTNLKKKNK